MDVFIAITRSVTYIHLLLIFLLNTIDMKDLKSLLALFLYLYTNTSLYKYYFSDSN